MEIYKMNKTISSTLDFVHQVFWEYYCGKSPCWQQNEYSPADNLKGSHNVRISCTNMTENIEMQQHNWKVTCEAFKVLLTLEVCGLLMIVTESHDPPWTSSNVCIQPWMTQLVYSYNRQLHFLMMGGILWPLTVNLRSRNLRVGS